MNDCKDIFEYITTQEAAYKLPIILAENWEWSMAEHIRLSSLYKHSQLSTGEKEFKPVKNITRPILNVQYRTEGFDVKDIVLFVDDRKNYYKSFLVKKFHEKWARDNSIDTVIDEMVESYVDYGGALLKNVNDVKPEVVPLQSIAFCDQTDLLSGAIGLKHFYSPDQLLDMASRGWGSEANGATATLENAVLLSREEKKEEKNGVITKTPGKYIEVYEVHGNFPETFLDPEADSTKYCNQLHIVCFYQKKDSMEKGFITLYKSEEKKSPFKLILRDKVYGRALGFGGAEELFEPQVWTNYDMIRMQDMLDSASKVILKAIGVEMKSHYPNGLRDMDNLEIVELAQGEDIGQIDTVPRSMGLFERSKDDWQVHAQQMGGATDALMGESPTAGTPFKLQDLITSQGQGLHEYRKGKLATFWNEVERDWIIPHLAKEISNGQEFLAELDLDEMQAVADSLVINEWNKYAKEKVLNGDLIQEGEKEAYMDLVRSEFKKGGSKRFIEIFKGEMKKLPISVYANIAGKQKNLAQSVDKLTNIFRFAFSNPQGFASTMQIPGMSKAFNEILEFSGLSPIDFSGIDKLAEPQPAPTEALPAPSALANA